MSEPIPWARHQSPLGTLTLWRGERGLSGLGFGADAAPAGAAALARVGLGDVTGQLDEYFAGARRRFDVPLDLAGTPFQRSVWEGLLAIPYGTTMSYSALAAALGRPNGARAVAAAVARTPVPIVIPCHRVVAVAGGLTGYVGGLERKRALIALERRTATHPDSRRWAQLSG